MYIKLTKSKTSKYTRVYLVEGFRDEKGKSNNRTIHCYGNLEELQKEDPNILEKLRLEAKNIELNQVQYQINLNDDLENQLSDKNYGYFFLEAIYEQLGISKFLKTYQNDSNKRYDINEVLKLLVFLRALNPKSKLATYEESEDFFVPFKVSLPSIYRSLRVLDELKESLQYSIHQVMEKEYYRDCSVVFYDVTNYYFETEYEDELKRKGVSKENRKSPIIQMGLFLDSNGLPISYKLFPGNTSDTKTLVPLLKEMRKKFNLGRIILTADKGLNSGNNLNYLKENGDGYIVSQKIRGSGKKFIDQILEEDEYVYNEKKTFKIKSFLRTRSVEDEKGDLKELVEKVVCFWSLEYQDREEHKRELLEERLQEFIDNPSKYRSSNNFGLKKYLKVSHLNKKTGEIEKESIHLEKNHEKYNKDKELDGYYALVTSEIELDEETIIARYKGLWKIEESFKVLKSDLQGRPVFVRKKENIEGHFLVCFLALLIMKILEFKLEKKHSIAKIQDALKNATCRPMEQGIFSMNKNKTNVLDAIKETFNLSMNKRYYKSEELRKIRKKISQYPTNF